jgi:hypothetical protein
MNCNFQRRHSEAGSISAARDRRTEKLENPTQPTP